MPVGYLASVLVPAVATFLALAPRSTGGPRATPSFILGTVANELPFLVFSWLAATTLLAAAQGDLDTPVGLIGLGVALLTTAGLAVVVWRATRARPALDAAMATLQSAGWRSRPQRMRLARDLIAPLRFTPRGVQRTRNIAYGPAGKENLLDVYQNESRDAGCPIFVYFHPGGFFSGRKSREARPIIDLLATGGWVCVSANYRLSRAGAFPNNLIDAKRVIAWLRDHAGDYDADPGTIVAAGGSAGAHLAAMCGLTPNDPTFQPGFERADTTVTAAIGLYGYYGAAPTSHPMPSSPADYACADAPPFLVAHGDHDPMVLAEHARRFADSLRAASSNPVVYAELPGGQHNFDRFPSIRCTAVADAIEAFCGWVRSPG